MKIPPMIESKIKRGLKEEIKDLLKREYDFITGKKIQEMFAEDLVKMVSKYIRDTLSIQVGQCLWYGVSVDEKPAYGRNSLNTRKMPIVLTLIDKEDLEMLTGGLTPREIRKYRVARLFKESYEQGTVLSNSDIAFLLNISAATVGKDVREYMDTEKEVLPTRSIIHDIGPTITHKRMIIEYYLQGYQTPEIARKSKHSETACDRYIRDYRRVRRLHKDGKSVEYIQQTLNMSKRLVEEYVSIYENMEVKDEE